MKISEENLNKVIIESIKRGLTKFNEENRGVTAHFDGKKKEETPEDKENAEHKFDDKYWAKKSKEDKLAEQQLRERIKSIIRERFESMGGLSQFEANDSEGGEPKPLKKSEGGKADFNDENQDEQERRAQVEKFFNQDGVDIAPYAYQLYHVEKREGDDTNEMKNARSKFMKCLNHEPNEAGYPYSFSSDETNKLQSMISSNQLNEGKRVIRIDEDRLRSVVAEQLKKALKNLKK